MGTDVFAEFIARVIGAYYDANSHSTAISSSPGGIIADAERETGTRFVYGERETGTRSVYGGARIPEASPLQVA
jgi:hypothetical protein